MSEQQNKDWFETWFDSPYYHILYKHRNYNEAELFISNLIKFLEPKPGSRFLDLACGKGRHSLFLNKKGFDVTGIDLSPESISHANEFKNEKLQFYVHDMRRLFRTNYFDYILNLFTSFGYFDKERDEKATIDAVAKGLKPGGMFVLDFFNARKVFLHLREKEELEIEGILFTVTKRIENNFIIKEIRFSDKGKDFCFQERVKALTLDDFTRYFSSCGLKIVHLWGNYNLEDFNPDSSDRLIILSQKNKAKI
ncbi:MAG: SAM-dependent methyltransferase [Bacteroidetes bacterium]|jgi:SAM-dependent methyltransferase|nr:SAM-dependent methyltransferase [Bacteroidota bacterium]